MSRGNRQTPCKTCSDKSHDIVFGRQFTEGFLAIRWLLSLYAKFSVISRNSAYGCCMCSLRTYRLTASNVDRRLIFSNVRCQFLFQRVMPFRTFDYQLYVLFSVLYMRKTDKARKIVVQPRLQLTILYIYTVDASVCFESEYLPPGVQDLNENQKWDPLREMKTFIRRKVGHAT